MPELVTCDFYEKGVDQSYQIRNKPLYLQQNEVFVDTKTMPIVKKRVRPIDQQVELESRRLWKEVRPIRFMEHHT